MKKSLSMLKQDSKPKDRRELGEPPVNVSSSQDFIKLKLEKLREKLETKEGVSKEVSEQNQILLNSILELEEIHPASKQLSQNQGSLNIDSSVFLSQAIAQFATIKAHLNRLVASQEEVITEIYERMPKELFIVKDIHANLKIRIHEKLSPLKIIFAYPGNPTGKSLSVYISHD